MFDTGASRIAKKSSSVDRSKSLIENPNKNKTILDELKLSD